AMLTYGWTFYSGFLNFFSESAAPSPCLWLGECFFFPYFLRISLPARFCDEQSGHSVYPFPCYPGPLARSWRRPFHRCGVPYPQAPTLDRDSLTTTIADFIHIEPNPARLNGTLGTSHSSAPFRNCTEAFDTAGPSQIHEQRKVPDAVLPRIAAGSPARRVRAPNSSVRSSK